MRPEEQRAGNDVAPIELRSGDETEQGEVQRVGEYRAEDDSGVRDQPVLQKEVTDHRRFCCTEGAARADLPAALGHGERRHAGDADAGGEDDQHDDRCHCADDHMRAGEKLVLVFVDRLQRDVATVV